METMALMGAEEVSRAASRMQQAAEEMTRAATAIGEAHRRHEQFLDEWAARLVEQLTTATKAGA